MESQGETTHRHRLPALAGVFLCLLLPAAAPDLLWWLSLLLPAAVFYALLRQGIRQGIRHLLLVVAAAALLTGAGLGGAVLFGLSLVPAGAILAAAAHNGSGPVRAGLQGSLMLLSAWALLFLALMGGSDNPYPAILDSLDQGFQAARGYYLERGDLSAETARSLEAALEAMRTTVPRILPALLCVAVLQTTWVNMVLGNWLLGRTGTKAAPWPPFRFWRLPDQFVWAVVAVLAGLLLSAEEGQTTALNGLVVLGFLYLQQGFAVVVDRLHRWNMPRIVRLFVYTLMGLQAYGLLLVAAIGLVDTWADFRRLNPRPSPE